jgi:hypothetical protein
MLFKSICASGEGIDAMERNPARWDGTRETRGCEDDEDRESPNLVDPATDYLARHGVDEPLIE